MEGLAAALCPVMGPTVWVFRCRRSQSHQGNQARRDEGKPTPELCGCAPRGFHVEGVKGLRRDSI